MMKLKLKNDGEALKKFVPEVYEGETGETYDRYKVGQWP